MLWWKILLGYCLLGALPVWFGYRSRGVWPRPDTADEGKRDAIRPP